MSGKGIPSGRAVSNPIEVVRRQRARQPAGHHQRHAGDDAHRPQRHNQRVQAQPGGQQPVDGSRRRPEGQGDDRGRPRADSALVQLGDDDPGQPGDGRHRQVQSAGHNQRRADRGHDSDEGHVRPHAHHVVKRPEPRRQPGKHREQQGEKRQQDRVAGPGFSHPVAQEGGVHAASFSARPAAARISSAAPTGFSNRAAIRPRARATERSASPATSSASDDTSSAAMPLSASSRSFA